MYKNRFGSMRGNGRQGGSHSRFPRGRNLKQVDPRLLVHKASLQIEKEYVPVHAFDDFDIQDQLKQNIKARGYVTPTPIQDQAIGPILAGRDVVGVANTGTGKTAAFLIPLLDKICRDRGQKVLIVAPTRELAVQINDECRAFGQGLNIFSTLCIGGVGLGPQVMGLRRNPSVVIGTVGRLRDLNMQGKLNFGGFANIVLDEVDRMLDMGFAREVELIVRALPEKRQSLFFSATIPVSVTRIMNSFLRDPVNLSVKTQETAFNVDQDIVNINGREKPDVLHNLLIQEGFNKVLIFGRTKRGIEKLAKELVGRGFTVVAIHGNKNQGQRQKALSEFKQNRVKILLATDIASRGLDIDDITHVINYDLPGTYEDYVHRIGRTGRAGKKGIALSFVG